MKKLLLILFGILIAIPAICQTTKVIFFNPADVFDFGNNTSVIRFDSRLVYDYRYIQSNSIDTVDYEEFIRVMVPQGVPGDKWIVTLRKLGAVVPPGEPVITIEAENMTVVNALKSPVAAPKFVEHMVPTSSLSVNIPTPKTKFSTFYSNGNTSNASVQLRVGSATGQIIATIPLPSTGSWLTFRALPEVTVNIPAGMLFMTCPVPANFDWFILK